MMEESARRGRPPKQNGEDGSAIHERRERRRKDGEEQNAGLRLVIPDWVREKYPESQYAYCWIINEPVRIADAHKRDWDPVDGVDRIPGAYDRHGAPTDHILHVKRQEWVREDREKAEAQRRQIEAQAERGRVTGRGDDASGAGLSENVSYTEASNRLR